MHCSRVATIQVLPSTLLWQRSRQVLALSAKKIEQYVASMLLYEAVTEQDEKIVENLLTQYKADPTVKAASGVSALSWSLEIPKGSFHVVERLCAGVGGLTLLDGKQCIIRGILGSSVGVAPTIQPNCRSTAC